MKPAREVIFYTAADKCAGYGHFRRCLSLAEALRQLKVASIFLLEGDPAAAHEAASIGIEALTIHSKEKSARTTDLIRKRKPLAVILDSYTLDPAYLIELKQKDMFVVVIDDLADRKLPVDLVINGSIDAAKLAYHAEKTTRFLLGPQYILLRSEFAEEPKRMIALHVRRVLVTVGGGDPNRLTARLVRWAAGAIYDASFDVVIGPLFDKPDVPSADLKLAAAVHSNPQNIHNIMLDADLALCGGGQTTYELAATGTPAVAVRLADNQTQNLAGLNAAGALVWAGDVHDADLEGKTKRALAALASDPARRTALSQRGRALVDGQGSPRVARAILDLGMSMQS